MQRDYNGLTKDILDVTKIESQSLNLKKEWFNLNDVITNTIDDIIAKEIAKKNQENVIKLAISASRYFCRSR